MQPYIGFRTKTKLFLSNVQMFKSRCIYCEVHVTKAYYKTTRFFAFDLLIKFYLSPFSASELCIAKHGFVVI